MEVDGGFSSTMTAAVLGLLVSGVIERQLTPRPLMRRPAPAWALHVGSWLAVFAILTLALARPWFAMGVTNAVLLLLVLVNNAKVHSLREAFVVQDFEYFTDAMRHPRLYIPFLGWWRFLGAVLGFSVAVALGLWAESVPEARFAIAGQLGAVILVAVTALVALSYGIRARLDITLDPNLDVQRLGLIASPWFGGLAARQRPQAISPFSTVVPMGGAVAKPLLIAVQSESFFDPRGVYEGIRTELLSAFDDVKREACAWGKLQVPAWGANTVRTEAAFLTGIDDVALGVHRFNPYRAMTAGWDPGSLASYLRRLGYRTICIHPYPASFYQRHKVYPRLGFDEFIDIAAFTNADRSGPYIGDVAVANKVIEIVQSSDTPLFVFVITMENHGPLHLERVKPGDTERLYSEPPPAGCDDLTIYLRHLCNADRMVGMLTKTLSELAQPASLCWYGDHVPIMPAVYDACGVPSGEVDFVIWSNSGVTECQERMLVPVSRLAGLWLETVGLWHRSSATAVPRRARS